MRKSCTACIPQIQVKDVKKTLYYRKRSKSKKKKTRKHKKQNKKINKKDVKKTYITNENLKYKNKKIYK